MGRFSCYQRMGNNYERQKSSLLFKCYPPYRRHAPTFKITKYKVSFTVYGAFRFRTKYGYYNVSLNLNQWVL